MLSLAARSALHNWRHQGLHVLPQPGPKPPWWSLPHPLSPCAEPLRRGHAYASPPHFRGNREDRRPAAPISHRASAIAAVPAGTPDLLVRAAENPSVDVAAFPPPTPLCNRHGPWSALAHPLSKGKGPRGDQYPHISPLQCSARRRTLPPTVRGFEEFSGILKDGEGPRPINASCDGLRERGRHSRDRWPSSDAASPPDSNKPRDTGLLCSLVTGGSGCCIEPFFKRGMTHLLAHTPVAAV